jgi:uncharacterized membrane protein
MISISTQGLGNPYRVLLLEALGFLVVAVPLILLVGLKATTPSTRADLLAVGAGFFAALGTISVIYAFKAGGRPEIVAPLMALSPAITVLWMWLFFSARLNLMQGLGVVLAIIAGFILAKYSP